LILRASSSILKRRHHNTTILIKEAYSCFVFFITHSESILSLNSNIMKFVLFAATVIYTMVALVAASPAPQGLVGGLPVVGSILSPPPPPPPASDD
jgi:hypothetical protein